MSSSLDDKAGRVRVAAVEDEEDDVTQRGRTRADELRRGRQSNILGVVDDAQAQRRTLLG